MVTGARFCPNENSLLNPTIRPGKQSVDKCVIDKLNRSDVSIRDCLRDIWTCQKSKNSAQI